MKKLNIDLLDIPNHNFKLAGFSTDEEDEELVKAAQQVNVTWDDLKEIFNRRNVIVHNDGRIDRQYIVNVGNGRENEYLISNNTYIKKSMFVFMYYGQFIYDKIITKIK